MSITTAAPAAPPPDFNSLFAETWKRIALGTAQPFLWAILDKALKEYVDFPKERFEAQLVAPPVLTFDTDAGTNIETIKVTLGSEEQPWKIRAPGTTKSFDLKKIIDFNIRGGQYLGLELTIKGMSLLLEVNHDHPGFPLLKSFDLNVDGIALSGEGAIELQFTAASEVDTDGKPIILFQFTGNIDNLLSTLTGGIVTKMQAKGTAALNLAASPVTVMITELSLKDINVIPRATKGIVTVPLKGFPVLSDLKAGLPAIYGLPSEPCAAIKANNASAKCEQDYSLPDPTDYAAAAAEIEVGLRMHGPQGGITVASLETQPVNFKDCLGHPLQVDGPLYDDFEDTAIWTGHCLAAEAFRYAAAGGDTTEQGKAHDRAAQLLTGIQKLFDVPGHYTLHGTPLRGLFCRAVMPDQKDALGKNELLKTNPNFNRPCAGDGSYYDQPVTIDGVDWYGFGRDDTPISRDQYVGVVLGLFFTGQFFPKGSGLKTQADSLLLSLVDYLDLNGWTAPTPSGPLDGFWTNYPITQFGTNWHMRLAFMRAASVAAGPGSSYETKYNAAADAIAPHVWIPGWLDTFSPIGGHYQKFNLHLGTLLVLMYGNAADAHYTDYLEGVNILRAFLKNHRNPYFNLVWAFCQSDPVATLKTEPSGFGDTSVTLAAETESLMAALAHRWTLVRGHNNLPKQMTTCNGNEYLTGADAVLAATPWAVRPDLRWGGDKDFMWQKPPADRSQPDQPTKEANGVDVLLPYYMARKAGLFASMERSRQRRHNLASRLNSSKLDQAFKDLNLWLEDFSAFYSESQTALGFGSLTLPQFAEAAASKTHPGLGSPTLPQFAAASIRESLNSENVVGYNDHMKIRLPKLGFEHLAAEQLYLSHTLTFLNLYSLLRESRSAALTAQSVCTVIQYWADANFQPPPFDQTWLGVHPARLFNYPISDVLGDQAAIATFCTLLQSKTPLLMGLYSTAGGRTTWNGSASVLDCFSPGSTVGASVNRLLNQ